MSARWEKKPSRLRKEKGRKANWRKIPREGKLHLRENRENLGSKNKEAYSAHDQKLNLQKKRELLTIGATGGESDQTGHLM